MVLYNMSLTRLHNVLAAEGVDDDDEEEEKEDAVTLRRRAEGNGGMARTRRDVAPRFIIIQADITV
jgi:hypothetical protein